MELKRNPGTKNCWKNAIGHLRDHGGEKLTFMQLDRAFFEAFKRYLLDNCSINSAKRYLDIIKTMLHRAVDDDILPKDPSAKVTIKKETKLPVFLTLEEVRKLKNTACGNENVKSAFLFSCLTGLRYSDVDGLTWDNIKDGYLEFSQQKTKSGERFPLSKYALEILEGQRNAVMGDKVGRVHPENSVFMFPRKSTVDKVIRHWVRDAGINKCISFHKSRHTFATLSLSSGVDIYTTSKLLGHRNLQTTQIYASVIDEKKIQAVNMLPKI
jgi:integrase